MFNTYTAKYIGKNAGGTDVILVTSYSSTGRQDVYRVYHKEGRWNTGHPETYMNPLLKMHVIHAAQIVDLPEDE